MVLVIIVITALTFIASFIGLATGFGAGTYMAPLILLGIPYKKALLFVCILHWFHDMWKTGFFIRHINLRLVFYFGAPGLAASYLGALVVIAQQPQDLAQILGAFLIISGLLLWLNPTFVLPDTKIAACTGGFIAGFLAGIFGMRGAIQSSFLSPFNLSPESYIATIGAISIGIDSIRMFTYWYGGISLSPLLHWALLFCLVASYVGALLGSRFLLAIPREKFRSFVAVSIIIAGVWILIVMRQGVLF